MQNGALSDLFCLVPGIGSRLLCPLAVVTDPLNREHGYSGLVVEELGISCKTEGSEEITGWHRMLLTFSLSASNYFCRAYHGFSRGLRI